MQEMVYLKAIQKAPQWAFLCREPPIKKCICKNLGGLAPPGSAYALFPESQVLCVKNKHESLTERLTGWKRLFFKKV